MKKMLLVVLAVLIFAILCWSLFGSFYIKEVIGQQCGLEMVVPCIKYDITREVDILDKYRTYAASIAGMLFIVSIVLLLKFGKQDARKS